MADKVLVTGASGFIATHCIIQLLEKGYDVRGTLRSMNRAESIREIIAQHSPRASELEFAEADLTNDDGWAEAAAGCTYMLHVASPFPLEQPKTDDELVIPAREGALRALRAARDAGVKRVVLTSSIAAIAYGHDKRPDRPFNEEDWSNPKGASNTPYTRSKTLAEMAAWDFMKTETPGFELSVVNPGAVLGPVLENDIGTSPEVVFQLMTGKLPGLPRFGFPVVDVRDVASCHILAMEVPEAAGERFACTEKFLWLEDMSKILKETFPEHSKKVPTGKLPNWLVRVLISLGAAPNALRAELGRSRDTSNEKAKRILGWQPRSAEEAVKATAQSLIDLKLV